MKIISNSKSRVLALRANSSVARLDIWSSALELGGLNCEETLIQENMDYLHSTRENVLARWGRKGSKAVADRWLADNPKTDAEIIQYYNGLDLYITALSSWHSEVNVTIFLRIVEFMQLCIKNKLSHYLDFGSGIGSCAIMFGKYGFNVTLADISDAMLTYSKWRLRRLSVDAKYIDLKNKPLPKNSVDCATAIEVLEHISDPSRAMSDICNSLKPGGYLFVTTPFFHDPNRPQHIVQDIQIANNFEKLGFTLLKITDNGLCRTYQKEI